MATHWTDVDAAASRCLGLVHRLGKIKEFRLRESVRPPGAHFAQGLRRGGRRRGIAASNPICPVRLGSDSAERTNGVSRLSSHGERPVRLCRRLHQRSERCHAACGEYGSAAEGRGQRLALYLVGSPLWLFGVAAMVGSFVFQALALYNGRLSVVQSILVTELVFSLVIGSLWLRRHVLAPAAWGSASVTSAGLAVFLIMAEPRGGHAEATTQAWLPALLTCGGVAALLAVLARRGSPVRRAALYATASGIVWAALATFLKSATDALAADGVSAIRVHGAVYGVVVAGIVGTILTPGRPALRPAGRLPIVHGDRQSLLSASCSAPVVR